MAASVCSTASRKDIPPAKAPSAFKVNETETGMSASPNLKIRISDVITFDDNSELRIQALNLQGSAEGMSFDEYFNIVEGMAPEDRYLAFALGLAPRATHIKYMDLKVLVLCIFAKEPVLSQFYLEAPKKKSTDLGLRMCQRLWG